MDNNVYIAYNNETEEAYLWKLGQAKDSGLLELDWSQIADLMNKQFREDESQYRTEAAYRKPYQQAKKFYEQGVFSKFDEDEYIKELKEVKDSVYKEKCKIQTEKLEYNRWRREEARDELILEKLQDIINSIGKLPVPNFYPVSVENDNGWLLAFGDTHFGIEFEVPDLYGNIINAYNPEMFEIRMNELLQRTISLIEKENISVLNVWDLGDAIQGILRLNSQLMKLKYGILDSAIIYGNYLSHWINELSKYVYVRFQMVFDSNHNQIRICNAPKNAFPEENVSRIILTLMKTQLANNERVTIIENPTGMNFDSIGGYSVLGVHGELKNITKSVGDFTVAYNTPINYIVGAHIHHAKEEEVGIDYEAITIPSVVGVDPYGMSLVKTSRAGAKLIGFTEGKGKTVEYSIRL